jgi:hypothetical protein
MQNLVAGFLIFLFALNASGCATIASSLPAIIAAINDSTLIVSQIESFVNLFFRLNPSPDKEQKIAEAIARVKTALEAAQRLANGVDKLDQGQVDAAFVEIRNAYTDLVSLCGSFGIGVKMTGKTMKATSGPGRTLTVPEPMIFVGKV